MKEIKDHIELLDKELEICKETVYRVELLKAKSTALLALANVQPKVVKVGNLNNDNGKVFRIEGYGFGS